MRAVIGPTILLVSQLDSIKLKVILMLLSDPVCSDLQTYFIAVSFGSNWLFSSLSLMYFSNLSVRIFSLTP